jgi:outer membrane translocation and assembly module TamA
LRRGLSLEASASTWWTAEPIYTSATYGAEMGVRYRFGPRRQRGGPVDSIRVGYVHDFLHYQVRPETLADLSNVDALIALGLDPTTGEGRGTTAAVTADYTRTVVDVPGDPHLGYGLVVHAEHADPALGGTFRYRELTAEARGYLPLGSTVLAIRARAGTLAARKDTDVPFSSRYFLGGSTSLRGWGRYEVAPLRDGIPIGGRSILDGSLEWRVPVTGPLGVVGFVDTGNVWAGDFDATALGLRTDVGGGLRYRTPIGLVRADIGVQMDPIDGLLINGRPATRRWRLHLSIGQAF